MSCMAVWSYDHRRSHLHNAGIGFHGPGRHVCARGQLDRGGVWPRATEGSELVVYLAKHGTALSAPECSSVKIGGAGKLEVRVLLPAAGGCVLGESREVDKKTDGVLRAQPCDQTACICKARCAVQA